MDFFYQRSKKKTTDNFDIVENSGSAESPKNHPKSISPPQDLIIPSPPPLPNNVLLESMANKNTLDDNLDDTESDDSEKFLSVKKLGKIDQIIYNSDSNSELECRVYVICKDNVPMYYCEEEENAHKIMWNLAKELKEELIKNDNNYNYYLCTEDYDDEVSLIGVYKNWLIPYENIFNKFTYYKVEKYL